MLVLPQTVESDHEHRRLVSLRGQEWVFSSECSLLVRHARDLIKRTVAVVFTDARSWKRWISCDEGWSTIMSMLASITCVSPPTVPRLMFQWIQFFQSLDVYVYLCCSEDLGLKGRHPLIPGTVIDCGPMFKSRFLNRDQEIAVRGLRYSTAEGLYIGGGPSLINHGCSECANVIIDYETGEVEVIQFIEANMPIRVSYNDDSEQLRQSFGIVCVCARTARAIGVNMMSYYLKFGFCDNH